MVLLLLYMHTVHISFTTWSKSNPESPVSEQKNLMHITANSTTLQSSTPRIRTPSNPQMNMNDHLPPLLCIEAQKERSVKACQ